MATAISDAVLIDIASGCLAGPVVDPDAIERALVARAADAARWSPVWHGGDTLGRDPLNILHFAETGPAATNIGHWTTPIAQFIELAAARGPLRDSLTAERQPATRQSEPLEAADLNGGGVLVVLPGTSLASTALGLDGDIRWDDYARTVLRNDILLAVTRQERARRELMVRRTPAHRGYLLPCWVGEESPATAPSAPSRSRRGRSRP